MIGTDPTAAARWRGSWPRLSFTLAVHLLAIKVRTVEMLILEVAKWSAFYEGSMVSHGRVDNRGMSCYR